jgi:hypothetical protein
MRGCLHQSGVNVGHWRVENNIFWGAEMAIQILILSDKVALSFNILTSLK